MSYTTDLAAKRKTKADAFMAAVRGIPAYHVAKALTSLSDGSIWEGCSKALMADFYARADQSCLIALDLNKLAQRARARQAGERGWEKK